MPRRFPFLVVLLVASGCLSDDDGGPTPTLDNLWPNADGTSWSYEMETRRWPGSLWENLYADPADVPPVPTIAELTALLADHPTGEPVSSVSSQYEMRFDGEITTESGATGQRLVQEVITPPPGALRATSADAGRAGPGEVLLGRIYLARPDLREAILATGALSRPAAELGAEPIDPLFLSGYAWEKNPAWIGGYGDLDLDPSWKYLEANLSDGHEFTHQLIPVLTDDVFLHAWISRNRIVETGIGTLGNAVECLYLVDFGLSKATDESGTLIGYARNFSYGTVVYAPRIGPAFSYERPLAETGNPPSAGFGDITLTLIGTAAP